VRTRVEDEGTVLVVESGIPHPCDISLVERKGYGHPDTLADHLAERLSGEYSRYTFDHFGAVLHHNFDKLALLGGASEVRYGSGRMLEPVRVLVNGRASRSCGGINVPISDLVAETTRRFFRERLPELDGHLRIDLNITANSSPGAVHADADHCPERASWFAPPSTDALRERRVTLANDTSLGTGWAPESPFEQFARELVDLLATPSEYRRDRPWCGSDVKLMGYASGDEVDIVLCVPQKSQHVGSRRAYLDNCEDVLAECHRQAQKALPGASVRFRINVRDLPERDELYLTYTGSSIESGDEGVVGRGNRINGLITPLRPMNLEGANGKNPVYHVGKLYNLAARRLAERLHEITGEYAEVHLVSATGQRLDRPWRVLVRLAAGDVSTEAVHGIVREALSSFPALTREIVATGPALS
jgi:S-adenosylmethionine synthetase